MVPDPEAAGAELPGVRCRREPGGSLLHDARRHWLLRARRPVYHALLPHVSFTGQGVEAIWSNAEGRAVLAWCKHATGRTLLVGLDVAEEIVRYTQGDPDEVPRGVHKARWNCSFERANYLFDANLVPGRRSVPWADRLGFTLVDLLARLTGLPLAEPLPQGAVGAVMLTGDDDQAPLCKYQEQLSVVRDLPITYFMLPWTRHTPATLAALPASVEIGVHVDALDDPDHYETLCTRQCRAVRALSGKPARSLRNHGFLSRAYLGHLRAWESSGIALDLNYAGLDGTALTGSFLPCHTRRPDGSWSQHLSLLTTFGDGLLYISKLSPTQARRRIAALAHNIERTHPGVLVFNMHPENIADTRSIHSQIIRLARRKGWMALGAESYLDWLDRWHGVTIREDRCGFIVHSPRAMSGLVLRLPAQRGWDGRALPAWSGDLLIEGRRQSA
ncbi:MAG TPA: hypothetical protein VG013_34615 [Gemmataceae bacterium]|nr:hypothetical protein [Gemmataceae bacterium]